MNVCLLNMLSSKLKRLNRKSMLNSERKFFHFKGLRSRLSCNISVNIIQTIYLIMSFLQSVFLHSQKKSFDECGNSPAIPLGHYQNY